MAPHPATGPAVLRRSWLVVTVVLALVALVSGPPVETAEAATETPVAVAAPGGAVVTPTSAPSPTSTSRPVQRRRPRPSRIWLPLVLAALVFLALLGTPPGYHSHSHRHSR